MTKPEAICPCGQELYKKDAICPNCEAEQKPTREYVHANHRYTLPLR